MDAVKYLKELDRMCRYYSHNCKKCLLQKSDFTSCKDVQTSNPKIAVEIVEKWSLEHPQKTILQDFLEKHPNAKLDKDGLPFTCAKNLGYIEDCKDICKDCWNRPLEG